MTLNSKMFITDLYNPKDICFFYFVAIWASIIKNLLIKVLKTVLTSVVSSMLEYHHCSLNLMYVFSNILTD